MIPNISAPLAKILPVLAGMVFTVVFGSLSAQAEEQCLACHVRTLDHKVVHPAASFSCLGCHVGHGDDTPFPHMLTETPNKLCFSCHDKLDYKKHVIAYPGSHPLSGRKDPIYPNKDFTCISCHNPHSSNQPKLFRYNTSGSAYKPAGNDLCSACHWNFYTNAPKPPRPPWND